MGFEIEHEVFLICMFVFSLSRNLAVFIFCFVVIAYILPSVFTLPLTLFFCNFKTKIGATSRLLPSSLVHSCVLTVWHKFSVIRVYFIFVLFFTGDMP